MAQPALLPYGFRWTLHAFPPWSNTRWLRAPTTAASHASYLRGWIKAIENDPMAIFTAAKNADRICEYMLGLEKQMTAAAKPMSPEHAAWVADYEREEKVTWAR